MLFINLRIRGPILLRLELSSLDFGVLSFSVASVQTVQKVSPLRKVTKQTQ